MMHLTLAGTQPSDPADPSGGTPWPWPSLPTDPSVALAGSYVGQPDGGEDMPVPDTGGSPRLARDPFGDACHCSCHNGPTPKGWSW